MPSLQGSAHATGLQRSAYLRDEQGHGVDAQHMLTSPRTTRSTASPGSPKTDEGLNWRSPHLCCVPKLQLPGAMRLRDRICTFSPIVSLCLSHPHGEAASTPF